MTDLPKRSFTFQTDYEGQAKKLLELMESTDVIIVAGGDGTLQEVGSSPPHPGTFLRGEKKRKLASRTVATIIKRTVEVHYFRAVSHN